MGDHRQEMAKYCEAMGFHHRITMPEDTQANGFAEAFMKMLFKLVHTAVVCYNALTLCLLNQT